MAKIIKIPSVYLYDTKVVGVSMENTDGTSRQEIIKLEVEENDKLKLEAEPDNAYDPNAIKVLSKNGNQIGYLNKEMAEKVKPALRHGTEMHITASWVNGEKMLGVGLRIELVN
jgi:phosphotransferase system HPr-like phosphotransfer protein